MISLSLCLIVRDEEHTLGRCLDSMAGIADEIIVLDTGSVDATKSVAIEHGARVFDFTWIDDFAAARNASFAHAEMDYIMWLDADDVLLPDYVPASTLYHITLAVLVGDAALPRAKP